jgi:hypothetical protein
MMRGNGGPAMLTAMDIRDAILKTHENEPCTWLGHYDLEPPQISVDGGLDCAAIAKFLNDLIAQREANLEDA